MNDGFDIKAAFIALLGLVVAILSWLGRQGWKRLDILEAESVKRRDMLQMHEDNKGQFREIKELLQEQNERADTYRRRTETALAKIDTRVAVIRSRMGDDPLKNDTGSFHRPEDE